MSHNVMRAMVLTMHWLLWGGWGVVWAGGNALEESRLLEGLHLDGGAKTLTLTAPAGPFQAILDEAATQRMKGVAILLPEAGARADAGVLRALRRGLPPHGWSTLSLQLPVLEAEAEPQEYWDLLPQAAARIAAAVARMKAAGIGNIALLGHGFGATAALRYLGQGGDDSVHAAVLLGPWWPADHADTLETWSKAAAVAVLDVYGERDDRTVLHSASRRRLLFKELDDFRQWRVSATGHDYRGRETWLVERIYGWLQRVAPGEEVSDDD
ncbi:hypothetical protein MIN45_P2272 [Methylomarinovum tepidoasis]|uniref:Alpha/beta hydrolase n=1 Tax=Methylomarinovum tepidoasis TaxID=2840183 RepID=A0AAU9CTY4_9GAMM|nr:alpha/beta fold hydrolase [Methylomarinovum sp. IN45]BCX89898.1 hypothetical protein MIN45_P2272 [Methylomarinovum sp. IN45]